jgi:chemotaxis protein CheY-P-specific phosphatase CheC
MRVDVNKLVKLNRMAKEGAKNVANNLSAMLGIDVEMKVTKIEFVDLKDIPETIGDEEVVGVYLMFEGKPSGFLVVLFPTTSAKKVAKLLLQGIGESQNGDKDSFTEMDISAIGEVGNIITSSFIDGWANLLKTEINISTPETVHDMGSAVIDPVLIEIGQHYDSAFLFNSLITARNEDIRCELFVIPDLNKLMEAVECL